MADGLVPLADAVRALRAQLSEALEEGQGDAIRFRLGPVELEFNVIVAREGKTGGKIGFMIFGQGAEANLGGALTKQQTQKLKLVLTPFVETVGPAGQVTRGDVDIHTVKGGTSSRD